MATESLIDEAWFHQASKSFSEIFSQITLIFIGEGNYFLKLINCFVHMRRNIIHFGGDARLHAPWVLLTHGARTKRIDSRATP